MSHLGWHYENIKSEFRPTIYSILCLVCSGKYQTNALFMKKHGLKNIWLALRRTAGIEFYNPVIYGDQSYWNWEHRINPAGPYASLGEG